MNTPPDRILNQLVVAALTLFIVVVLLLAALVGRQLWLQQNVATLSSDLQSNLETLGETTQVIQEELAQILTTPDRVRDVETWEEISEVLDDVDLQLSSLEEGIDEVALALDPLIDPVPPAESATNAGRDQEDAPLSSDPVDQIFTIFAALVALSSIAIAILLGISVRIHQRASAGPS